MARLLLIRHAPTPETGKTLTGRLPGVSLADGGVRAARRTAEVLAPLKVAAIYASPIERTWETALEIAAERGIDPIAHEGLLEVDYGAWSGRTLASLSKLKAWRVVQTTPSRMTFPGGESLVGAQARAVAACESIAAAHKKATVALVTHADIIKAVIAHYLGQPLDLFQRIGVAPASVSVVDLPDGMPPMVRTVNSSGDPASWN